MSYSKREPIGNTCPEIDGYIRNIKSSIYSRSTLSSFNEEALLEAAEEMSNELDNCINYLESMRTANATLRDWGNEGSERVSELEIEVGKLQELRKSLLLLISL